MKNKMLKSLFSVVLCFVILITFTGLNGTTANAETKNYETELRGETKLHNYNSSGYSYIWFGSYPQTEIDQNNPANDDLISEIDSMLGNVENVGDCWIGDTKYRKISASSDYVSNSRYFASLTYRYYKWERIKWRVLSVSSVSNEIFVMADKGIDDRAYADRLTDVTWENSKLRSWLNGYGAEKNIDGLDYSQKGKGFYNTAFIAEERNAIIEKEVENQNQGKYNSENGNDTMDKIFALSYKQVCNTRYGFADAETACANRALEATDYAHMVGGYVANGKTYYLLRSITGSGANKQAMVIDEEGKITNNEIYGNGYSVVPVLTLKYDSDVYYLEDDGKSGSGKEYGITYVLNGGTNVSTNPDCYIHGAGLSALATPTRTGFKFDGWYLDSAFTQKVSSISKEATGNYVLYAKWVKEKVANTITAKDIAKEAKTSKQTIKLKAMANGGSALTYTSSDKKIKVDGKGSVTIPAKWVGKVTITITSGETADYFATTKTVTIEITPAKTSLSSIKSSTKGGLTVNWKTAKIADGYEILYSTDKNFKSAKKITVKKASTKTYTIKKLKSNKKYYVKIRVYKKNGKNKLYSAFSKVQNLKVK